MKRALGTLASLVLQLIRLCGRGWGVDTSQPVKVFILAGQSNMEGKAKLELLEYQADAPETREFFNQFRKDGRWVVRDDAWADRGRHTHNVACLIEWRSRMPVDDLELRRGS
jgi:hypothetical protein